MQGQSPPPQPPRLERGLLPFGQRLRGHTSVAESWAAHPLVPEGGQVTTPPDHAMEVHDLGPALASARAAHRRALGEARRLVYGSSRAGPADATAWTAEQRRAVQELEAAEKEVDRLRGLAHERRQAGR